MSADIYIKDPETNETYMLDVEHGFRGGTYAIGGTREAWLNITYNYSGLYHSIWGHGLLEFDGMTVAEAKPLMITAIERLGAVRSDNYWEATWGNAGAALQDLMQLMDMFPQGKLRVRG